MRLHRPFETMTPTLDGDVLKVLSRTTHGLTGRRVADLVAKGSQRGVADVLTRLTEQGVVERRQAGSAYLYELNRAHLAADAVLSLASAAARLDERIATAVAAWDAPAEFVVRFGSSATGEMRLDSDIDLLVVGPTNVSGWDEQTFDLAMLVAQATGNDARILEYSSDELRNLLTSEPVLMTAIDHGICVHGGGQALRALRNRAMHGLDA